MAISNPEFSGGASEDLFAIGPSNTHQSLLLRDPAGWRKLSASLNRESIAAGWTGMEFDFQTIDKKARKVPAICTVYVTGVLALRADVKSELFPDASEGVEFLPITVGAEKWLLLNCLSTVTQFDEEKSQVMRALEGDIFMVLKLRVTDPAAQQHELFTLAQSNRMQLFARSSFKRRVEELQLKGVMFQLIGEIAFGAHAAGNRS